MAGRTGQQLGHYRLVRLLGRGGFAEVYLGEHLRLGTQAAIKVLYTALEDDDVEGFLREAQTVALLKHPHIVRVFDFDIEDHTPFLVMDYLPNGSVRRLYPKGTPLPLSAIVSYVTQIASALQYAHDRKVIHRDVKPENMLLDRDNTLLLSDFGIALMAQSSRYQSTQEVAGTAAYMAPEQFQGHPHRASDQYALGVVVYEWLTGDRPFHGTFSEIASQHLFVPPPPLCEKVPTISPAIEQVVLTALAKDPKQRFVSVQAFATSLATPPPTTPIAPLVPSTTQLLSPSGSQLSKRRISRRAVVIGLTGLVIAGSGLTWLALSQGSKVSSPMTHSTTTATPQPPGTTLLTYRGHSDQINSVSWSPDGEKIASASKDGTVQIWSTSKGNLVIKYASHYSGFYGEVYYVAWSPDGREIAAGTQDNTVRVWNAITTNLMHEYTGDMGANDPPSIAWSPDSKYIASGAFYPTGSKGIYILDITTGNFILKYEDHSSYIENSAWSPDGKKIASTDNNTVHVWNPITGKLIIDYTAHSDIAVSLAWSPDGKYIASGSWDKTVQVWEALSGKRVINYTGHSDQINSVSWSPDGKYIASGSWDKTVQVWDAIKGDHSLVTYRGHTGVIESLAWSPDSKKIVSGSWDKTVQVWQAV